MTEPVAEIFKPAFGYEENYEVSNTGRVKSIKRINPRGRVVNEKFLKLVEDKSEYILAHLSKNGIARNVRVHRLVAQTFIPNLENKPQVNHIDENKSNNRLDNLEWCTAKENTNFGTHNTRMSKSKHKQIVSISSSGLIRFFDSVESAYKTLNLKQTSVSAVLNKRQNHTGGYRFMYVTLKGVSL